MKRQSKVLLGILIGAGAVWYGVAQLAPLARTSSSAVPADVSAVPITDGRAEVRDVPIWLSGIGSVQPLNAVTVKVRVDGQLERVAFTEGQDVRAGDLLAQIDPRPFQAQLKQAQANKAKDEAQLANARLDLARFASLESRGNASRQNVDTQKAQVAALEATVDADQAAIDMAALQLDFSTIRAPLDGRAGLRLVDPGTIVRATDPGGLVTITQMQPIAVSFTVSQDDLPDILAAMARGAVVVVAYDRAGERPLARGRLVFVDSQVEQATGQVKLKAAFDNADRALWPGEFVNAHVQVKIVSGATVVPATAIQRGQEGTYVFRIKPDDTVEVEPVTVGGVSGGAAIVAGGLSPGDRVVVDGQYRLQPGSRIEARPAPAIPAS